MTWLLYMGAKEADVEYTFLSCVSEGVMRHVGAFCFLFRPAILFALLLAGLLCLSAGFLACLLVMPAFACIRIEYLPDFVSFCIDRHLVCWGFPLHCSVWSRG